MKRAAFIIAYGLCVITCSSVVIIAFQLQGPHKVVVKADPLMLQEACITGYIGRLKPISIDLVVDANVYCMEKYPK